jgi:RNA polymerase sigma-B factor
VTRPPPASAPVLPRQSGRGARPWPVPAQRDLCALARMGADHPDRAALRDRLVEQHLPVVRALAARYRNFGEPLDDLVQVGTIGLIHAIDRYDPDRGVPLMGYATPVILGEIRRHLRDLASTVRIPRQVHEVQHRVSTTTADLTQRLQRAPTIAEIACASGVDADLVVETLDVRRARATVPLDASPADGRDGGWIGGSTLDDVTNRDPTNPALVQDETPLEEVLHREALRPVLAQLDERQKRILVLRFFRGLTQREIAAELGISQMHVSRMLARTLERLRAQVARD